MTRLFISHWSEDSELVSAIASRLSDGKKGHEFFVATKHLDPGIEWEKAIREKLRSADAFVVLCSKNALGRYWVGLEIGAAWAMGKPIYPVRMEDEPADLPVPLSGRQAYDARRKDASLQTNAVVRFLEDLADNRAEPAGSQSHTELASRIDATLRDVKDDFERIRRNEHEQRIHFEGGETLELTRTYLELTNDENKAGLGDLWEPLWKKYELVRGMWDRQKGWREFETQWFALDAQLTRAIPEMRRHHVIDDELARVMPELRPFVGKMAEIIVRD